MREHKTSFLQAAKTLLRIGRKSKVEEVRGDFLEQKKSYSDKQKVDRQNLSLSFPSFIGFNDEIHHYEKKGIWERLFIQTKILFTEN